MKSIKKIVALVLAIALCFAIAACDNVPRTKDAQWGFKAGDTEYPVGTYIFPLVNAYNYAYSYLSYELGDDFDKDASILDLQSSFDEAGKLCTAKEYILKQAEDYVKYMIAIDLLTEELGVVPSDEAVANATNQSRVDWYLGDVDGAMNGYAEAMPAKDTYEDFGISYDSYHRAVYLSGRKGIRHDAIFSRLYGKGGDKAVSDDELKAYFEEFYSSYKYFIVPLYETAQDAATGEQVNVTMDDKKTKEIKEKLASYVDMLKSGDEWAIIQTDYMLYASVSKDSFGERIEKYDDVKSSMSEEIAATLKDMKEKNAQVVYLGIENMPIAVFIYKDTIKDKTQTIMDSEADRMTLVRDLKYDEYSEYLVSKAESVSFEINKEILSKFTPEFVERVYNK